MRTIIDYAHLDEHKEFLQAALEDCFPTKKLDRILLVADASAPPDAAVADVTIDPAADKPVSTAEQVLVLLHARDKRVPSHTAEWLERRPRGQITSHVHVRSGLDADIGRLARTQGDGAIGLVLCGGGARCFAHLGVYKALQEHRVQVDLVGATGMGAVMGAPTRARLSRATPPAT